MQGCKPNGLRRASDLNPNVITAPLVAMEVDHRPKKRVIAARRNSRAMRAEGVG